MVFAIIHGSFGSPDENWFPELKEKLMAIGQQVIVPAFPCDNYDEITKKGPENNRTIQNLDSWLNEFAKYLPKLKNEKLCFIGHSLGPLFILHLADKYNLKMDCAIFVSPFLVNPTFPVPPWQFNVVNKTFYKADFDWEKLKQLIPLSYVLYSDNDPYIPKKYSLDFAEKLASSSIFVRQAGHMNAEVKLNEFPLVYELCKTRINLTLYQKYLEQRRELFAIDYTKGKTEEIIYLRPEEVVHEGVFHFRNLRREGFCTLFVGSGFWDNQSRYMQEARKAAKRANSFVRVFVIDKMSELNNVSLRQQFKLDLDAGIKIYLITLSDIKKLTPEIDFGLWDDDYVCIVHFNHSKKVSEIKLSSRKIDIKNANIWKKKILQKAVPIKNPEKDIKQFIKKYLK